MDEFDDLQLEDALDGDDEDGVFDAAASLDSVDLDIQLDSLLDGKDVELLFELLHDADLKIAARAALVLIDMEKPVVLHLLKVFADCPMPIQRILIILFASIDFVEVYLFLLDLLKTSTDRDLNALIVAVLARTDYPVLPLVLSFYGESLPDFRVKLRSVLRFMDKQKLRELLGIFPVIPQEALFRDIFGQVFVDSIYNQRPLFH